MNSGLYMPSKFLPKANLIQQIVGLKKTEFEQAPSVLLVLDL